MPKIATMTILVKAQSGDANFSGIVAAAWRTNVREMATVIGLVLELKGRSDGVFAYALDRSDFDFLDAHALDDFIEATVHRVEPELLSAPDFDLESHVRDVAELLETQIQDCFYGEVHGKGPEVDARRIKIEPEGIRLCGNLDDGTDCITYLIELNDLQGYHVQLQQMQAGVEA